MLLCAAQAAIAADSGAPPLGTTAFLDYKNGLRDVHFGSSPSAIPGLGPLRDNGEVRCATREKEKLELGAARLRAIDYCFLNDKLARIDVSFASVIDTELGLEGLISSWGAPLSTVRVPEPSVARRTRWIGKQVRAVLLTREHVGEGGTLTLMSSAYVEHEKQRDTQRDREKQERFGKDL